MVDGNRDAARQVLDEGKLVGAVPVPGCRSRDRDRAEPPPTRSERDADDRSGVHSAQEPNGLLSVRALVERRDDLRLPALDDGAHRFLRLLVGCTAGVVSWRLGSSDAETFHRASFLADIDDAPVGEVPNHHLGNPLGRAFVIVRRSRQIGGLTEKVESALPFDRARNGRSFCSE